MAEDTRKRLLRYLNDAHAMEAGGLVTLQDIAERVTYPDARRVTTELCAVAKTQVERLASRITALGGTVSGNKTLFNSALAKGNRLTNAFHDQADKETQDIMKAYALSHLEVAAYTSLREYAQATGDTDTATLAQKLIEEEEQAAVRLYILIPDLAVIPASPRYQSVQGDKGSVLGSGGPLGALTLPALLLGSAALTYYGVEYLRHKGSKEDGNGAGNGGSLDKNAFGTTSGDYPSLSNTSSYSPTSAMNSGDTAVVVVDVIEVDVIEVDDKGIADFGTSAKKSSSSGSKGSSGY